MALAQFIIIIFFLFLLKFLWAIPWGTAIQGRLTTEPVQALKTPFPFKNQFNIWYEDHVSSHDGATAST